MFWKFPTLASEKILGSNRQKERSENWSIMICGKRRENACVISLRIDIIEGNDDDHGLFLSSNNNRSYSRVEMRRQMFFFQHHNSFLKVL